MSVFARRVYRDRFHPGFDSKITRPSVSGFCSKTLLAKKQTSVTLMGQRLFSYLQPLDGVW